MSPGAGEDAGTGAGDAARAGGAAPAPSPPAAAAPPVRLPRRRWLAVALTGALLALAVGGVLLVLTFDASTLAALARVGPGIALVLGGLMTAGWLAAAGRLHLLTASVGHRLRFRDSLAVAVSGEFGVAASPTGLGGMALRLGMLRARGVPLGEGTAVVGADLVLDGGVAILITAVALPLAFLLPASREMATELAAGADPGLGVAAGVLLAALLAVALAVRGWLRRRGEGTAAPAGPPPDDPSWRERVRRALHRVRQGMATLFRHHPRTVAAGFLLALVQLLCRYSILPVVVVALAGPAPVFALYPLQGLLNMVAHLVVVPGGGGSVELGAGVVLALFLPAALVGAAVLLWRLFTFHWNLFVGGAVFLLVLAVERRRRAGVEGRAPVGGETRHRPAG